MGSRLPPLKALRAFEAAGRHASFRLAAEELCVTESAVSHQVRRLERELGVALFVRRGRRVELSQAGALLHPVVKDAFDRLARGTALVRATGFSGELTLQVYVSVAVRWLLPRLYRFHDHHPDIAIRLSTSYRGWDFEEDFADCGLIYKKPPLESRYHYVPLFRVPVFPVLSPKLIEGRRLRPRDLGRMRIIRIAPVDDDWQRWLEAAGVPGLEGRSGPRFDTYLLGFEAAVAGEGVVMAAEFLVRSDLETGRLVRPFALEVMQRGSWYLVFRRERRHDPRIARLAAWLRREVAQDPLLARYAETG